VKGRGQKVGCLPYFRLLRIAHRQRQMRVFVFLGVQMLCDDAIVETFCQCGEKDKSTVAHLRSIADQPDMVCRNCKRSFLSFRPKLMDVIENDGKYPFERLWLLRKVA
jgi:hypothetical protein